MYCLNPPVAEPPEGNDDEVNNNNNNSYYFYLLLSPHYGADLVLRAFHILSHLIITTLWGRYNYNHITHEETEAQFNQLKFQLEGQGDVSQTCGWDGREVWASRELAQVLWGWLRGMTKEQDSLQQFLWSALSIYFLLSDSFQPCLQDFVVSELWKSKENRLCKLLEPLGWGSRVRRAATNAVLSLVGSWSCHFCWELLKEKASAFGCQA